MEKSIQTLQEWMIKQSKQPELADIIVERLHQWHKQHGTTDTIYIIRPRTRGHRTTSRPSWMANNTRRMPRSRMDMRPTELLRMASLQKNRTTVDHIAHH